jgi:ribonuclease-3
MSGNISKVDQLAKSLGYKFSNLDILQQAITHVGVSDDNNEDLAWLGDRVLGQVIASELFYRYRGLKKGPLTQMLSDIVNNKNLTKLGKELFKLDEYRVYAKGTQKQKDEKLGGFFEAIIGAIWIDSKNDMTKVGAFIRKFVWQPSIHVMGAKFDRMYVRPTANMVAQLRL